MILILPIGTDNPIRRRPRANHALIIINVVVFIAPFILALLTSASLAEADDKFKAFILTATHPRLYEFITYAFLHANVLHIFGNMFFLYIFGNNVNSQLGNTEKARKALTTATEVGSDESIRQSAMTMLENLP